MVKKATDQSATTKSVSNRTGFTPEEISFARAQTWRAMQLLNLVDENGSPICPVCGENAHGKFKLHADGGIKHHSRGCSLKAGPAVDLLLEHSWGKDGKKLRFTDAIAALIGAELSAAGKELTNLTLASTLPSAPPIFVAKLDVEVYDFIRSNEYASVDEAVAYYSEWHILPEAVREAGAVVITDAKALQAELTKKFGTERLIACGIAAYADPDKKSKGVYFVLNERYQVIEPHIAPSGHTLGMQFRPTGQTKVGVKAHKEWKRAYALDPEHGGVKAEYVTPFFSIRGAGNDSLIGCGLYRVSKLTEPTEIWIVEGFKDLLAARSMGFEAYAVPGVGARIPDKVMQLFLDRGHNLVVCLDGDEAGQRGRIAITAALSERGVPCIPHPGLPDGMDVADVLVKAYAESGCQCATCAAWRLKASK